MKRKYYFFIIFSLIALTYVAEMYFNGKLGQPGSIRILLLIISIKSVVFIFLYKMDLSAFRWNKDKNIDNLSDEFKKGLKKWERVTTAILLVLPLIAIILGSPRVGFSCPQRFGGAYSYSVSIAILCLMIQSRFEENIQEYIKPSEYWISKILIVLFSFMTFMKCF